MSNEQISEKTWAMICHLSSLSGYIGFPIGNIAGPLIVWLIKKDSLPMVDMNGKEALNFNISLVIYSIICTITIIGILLIPVIIIFHIINTILAAIKINDGEVYIYPLTIKFLK